MLVHMLHSLFWWGIFIQVTPKRSSRFAVNRALLQQVQKTTTFLPICSGNVPICYLNKSWWCLPCRRNIYSGRSLVPDSCWERIPFDRQCSAHMQWEDVSGVCRPVARFWGLGGKYMFNGKRLFICLKQIFLGITKFGGHKKNLQGTARECPLWLWIWAYVCMYVWISCYVDVEFSLSKTK